MIILQMIKEGRQPFAIHSCSLASDVNFDTKLTITLIHDQFSAHDGVLIYLSAYFFNLTRIHCGNVELNGTTPPNCEIPQTNSTCSTDQCLIRLRNYDGYNGVTGGTDIITIGSFTFNPGDDSLTTKAVAYQGSQTTVQRECDPLPQFSMAWQSNIYIYIYIL